MTSRRSVKITAHFERSLESLESFLAAADASQAFDALLDELTDTVIPNLEQFPGLGRVFLEHPARSVEAVNGAALLTQLLADAGQGSELREYVMTHHVLLYARIKDTVYLLSIRHQRQLSFDFDALWARSSEVHRST